MKLYTALKGIQGIFAVFFFLVLLWLSGDGAVSPLGCRLTILSGFVMTFVFLGLDLVSWRRLKKEERLTLLIQTDLLTRLLIPAPSVKSWRSFLKPCWTTIFPALLFLLTISTA